MARIAPYAAFTAQCCMYRPLNKLPPPMLADNYESPSDCLREEDLKQAAVAGKTEVTCSLCRAMPPST